MLVKAAQPSGEAFGLGLLVPTRLPFPRNTYSGYLFMHVPTQDGQSEFASSKDRDEMVQWLCLLTDDLHYRLEVFFRATALLDAFLSLMKVN